MRNRVENSIMILNISILLEEINGKILIFFEILYNQANEKCLHFE